MWYLRRFFFVSPFARHLQLLRHLAPFYFGTNDLFGLKQQVVLLKTTGCFTQNVRLFYSKRRVVLLKTTGCSTQTTGCFTQNDESFVVKSTKSTTLATVEKGIVKSSIIPPLTRTRART